MPTKSRHPLVTGRSRLVPFGARCGQRVGPRYTNNRSLPCHRDDVAVRLGQVERGLRATDYSHETTDLWEDLRDLFDLIDKGHRRYGVQAYNGGLFDLEADSFLSEKSLPLIKTPGGAPFSAPWVGLVDHRSAPLEDAALACLFDPCGRPTPGYGETARNHT
jgi:hypothetical protein